MPPTVSVVIPTCDRAPVLARAIDSVLGQTLRDLELLIVDEGSTDDTAQSVASFRDERIRLVTLPRGRGPNHSRNVGIGSAAGEFVAFLDSDDEWRPRKLERQLARLRESAAAGPGRAAAVAYCRYDTVDALTGRHTRALGVLREGEIFDALVMGLGEGVPTSTLMTLRSALIEVGGFDEALPSLQDYELLLRFAGAGHRFVAVPESLVVKHQHLDPQVTDSVEGRLLACRRLEQKWGRLIRERFGDAGYARWRAFQQGRVQFARFMAVRSAVGHGERAAAWRGCAAMLGRLPWSRRYVARGIVLATLGPTIYRALADLADPVLLRAARR
jgi:glycosyltransferase involved in cell wall biosynthesis